jgi:transcriptional regulator with XRE-family HTH domain
MRRRLQRRTEKFLSALGDAVRHRRVDLCISQEELAARCTMHRTYITDVESGYRNVSILTLLKIADGLNVEAWELLRPMPEEANA